MEQKSPPVQGTAHLTAPFRCATCGRGSWTEYEHVGHTCPAREIHDRHTPYTPEQLQGIVEMLRAAGVKTFTYGDLQLTFEGVKDGKGAQEVLRNPGLRRLLEGKP